MIYLKNYPSTFLAGLKKTSVGPKYVEYDAEVPSGLQRLSLTAIGLDKLPSTN
jgi:hypothetical protein